MPTDDSAIRKQIDDLLNIPRQLWLLGAGISKSAGIPLMHPLTKRVRAYLAERYPEQTVAFDALQTDLDGNPHVEDILSQLTDLIAVAERTRKKDIQVGEELQKCESLRLLHAGIQEAIRFVVQWGYIESENENPERIGQPGTSIVTVDDHRQFVRCLFRTRRAGLERRPPVVFFTTNYDTLLEDALALERIHVEDGFRGGAMAFWESGVYQSHNESLKSDALAHIFKLHGSIDWYASDEDVVVRRRHGAGYPPDDPSRLLIYPQATKYRLTQSDPFASMFAAFRTALHHAAEAVLVICGYSFGDSHINEEIFRALKHRACHLTVLAFVNQPDGELVNEGLPDGLAAALSPKGTKPEVWQDRLIAVGRRGVYHGSLDNCCPADPKNPHDWWSFRGLTQVLERGTSR